MSFIARATPTSMRSAVFFRQQRRRRCVSTWLAATDNTSNDIGEHHRFASLSSSSSSSSIGGTIQTGDNIARRTVHVEHHRSGGGGVVPKPTDGASAQPGPSSRNRSRRTRGKQPRRSLDDRKVPSYKEFVHRFTVLSLYRGFLKCIRDSMPHNQEDLREQVRKEFQANKHDTHSFTVKQNIAEGQRRFEELKEFTGQSNKYTGESWINIQDPDDPRGRVGTGWPWAK